MDLEAFWAIMVYAFVLGLGALGGFVFFYWLVIIPRRVFEERGGPTIAAAPKARPQPSGSDLQASLTPR